MNLVAFRAEESKLRSLSALSTADGGGVGAQIRRAIDEYLESRREEVKVQARKMEEQWKVFRASLE